MEVIMWKTCPVKCEHTSDHTLLAGLCLLRLKLCRNHGKITSFLGRLHCLDDNILTAFAKYLSGKEATSADVKLMVDGYNTYIKDLQNLSKLATNLPVGEDPFDSDGHLRVPQVTPHNGRPSRDWQVFPPAALWTMAPKPCLTLDEDGHLAVYRGKPKSMSRDIYLLCPMRESVEDRTVCLDDLVKKTADMKLPADPMPVEELVVICVDTSYSMINTLSAEDTSSFEGVTDPILDSVVDMVLRPFKFHSAPISFSNTG